MVWLLLTHPAALLLFYLAVPFWIRRDVADITKNGSIDTLHGKFHRQRLTWRVAQALAFALLGTSPLLLAHATGVAYCVPVLASLFGLLALGGAYTFYAFTPGLNQARQLAYVPRYYVSPDPEAAYFPDRIIWARAVKAFPRFSMVDADQLQRLRQEHAGWLLKELLQVVLLAGLITYPVCLAVGWYFCRH
jgi:hypothetical protein